jgi:N-acetylmuramoyl-L-alanine amidase
MKQLKKEDQKSKSIEIKRMSKYTYILDPGHGGINPATGEYVTSGKRSPKWEDGTQYFEGVGNRDIVDRISKGLDKAGISYRFTVDPSNWRDLSLPYRTKQVNKWHKASKNCILFSIHSNGFKKESANGFEVFTSLGETKSDPIADILFKEFAKAFPELSGRKDTKDGDFDKEANFYIIKNTYCPAVLLESMFHTNERECKMLMDPEVRQKIAQTVINTILTLEREG